jgi:hypothetical protein
MLHLYREEFWQITKQQGHKAHLSIISLQSAEIYMAGKQ